MSQKMDYKSAGVNIEEGYKAVEMMKDHVKTTFNKNVLTGLGGFGGLFQLDMTNLKNPVLVSGTDGVGTKLKLAFLTDKHDTVGEDLVAMCVNDILCQGAKPLFFLDYLATGKLEAEKAADIVKGVASGCRKAGCALIGGETAEMPGFYEAGEYDMAGFAVGVVDRDRIIDGSQIKPGDVIMGLPSSGIHSNGYSLVRKVFFEQCGYDVNTSLEAFESTLGDVLLTPTRIYVEAVMKILEKVNVHGMSHITGGGFYENVPRMLPEGTMATFKENAWPVPKVFEVLQEKAGADLKDMYNTFNMGIGLMLVVDSADVETVQAAVKELNEEVYVIGEVEAGEGGVKLWF